MTQKTTLFVVADEATNAGERDYMKALAESITKHGINSDNAIFVYKIPGQENTVSENMSDISGDPTRLPVTDEEYALVPRINEQTYQLLSQNADIQIIGLGNSTLPTLLDLTEHANKYNVSARSSYVTHKVNGTLDACKLIDNNITLFTEASREELAEQFDEKIAEQLDAQEIHSVPHTNTKENCAIEAQKFLESPNGQTVQAWDDNGEKFAFVFLNAGFKVNGKHVPYTKEEAEAHASALVEYLPLGTHLLLCHGGLRNVQDEEETGDDIMTIFMEAYMRAQLEKGYQPQIVQERYKKGLSYNIVKASFEMLRMKNCVGYIAASEANGTIDKLTERETLEGIAEKKKIAAFSFDAEEEEVSRIQRRPKALDKGVTRLNVTAAGELLVTEPDPDRLSRYSWASAPYILSRIGLLSDNRPANQPVTEPPAPV